MRPWAWSQISIKPNFLGSERERHSKLKTQRVTGCSTPLGGGEKGLWAGAWCNLGIIFDEGLMLAERSGAQLFSTVLRRSLDCCPFSFETWSGGLQTVTMSWSTAMCSKLGWWSWLNARSRHRMQLETFSGGRGLEFFFQCSIMLFEEIELDVNIKDWTDCGLLNTWIEMIHKSLKHLCTKF